MQMFVGGGGAASASVFAIYHPCTAVNSTLPWFFGANGFVIMQQEALRWLGFVELCKLSCFWVLI